MYVIEQPLPATPAANSEVNVMLEWNAIYDAYNEVACLILDSMIPELHRQFENSSSYDMIKELKAMFEKQARVERFDLIQTFHACKQEEGKPVAALTKDFVGFVRNYNMHNMGKTIGELHAMLIGYEKGLPKKAEIPQVLVDLLPGCKTIRSKWIFKKKTDMDSIVHTYKARLVAKGYTQLYGVDYEETFSPVADIRSIRILISITAYYDYEIWKMDIKTAFLNGYLDKDIYMVQPEGFVDPNHPRKVCKLQRSIYGLKQASRSWNKRFDEEIKRFGFAQNLDEPCVYQKASGSNVTFLIFVTPPKFLGRSGIPLWGATS
ncbi:retrotransposon protein, putative, ty1-copia subclass [Tanacetum coccineum]